MAAICLRTLAVGLALVPASNGRGADVPPSEPARLAARSDELLAARWASAGVKPAARSADAEFLRRVYLDLTGRIPPVAAVRQFLTDRSPRKRQALADRLLGGPGYIRHVAGLWRRLLAADAEEDPGRESAVASLDKWLARQFADDRGLDQIARELLTWDMDETQPRRDDPAAPSPRLFFLGREDKPAELAAATSRVFLGIRLECAQCHDHPFARWTREQFWSQAVFFTGLRRPEAAVRVLTIPGTGRSAAMRFLDGTVVPERSRARTSLAEWITSSDNRFFARAAVNHLWEQLFGIGLVDPVDDMAGQNPPSHPEILDELARAFVAGNYNLKYILRALVLTNAYQASSAAKDGAAPLDPRLFARMNVKGLTPEQAFDSLIEATGYRGSNLPRLRGRFLARFPRDGQRLEGHTSIPQALALMNGDLLNAAIQPDGETTLAAVLRSPFLDTGARVETLFLAALGRMPEPGEKVRFVNFVNEGGAAGTHDRALGDVFWALLNSAEFLHNH